MQARDVVLWMALILAIGSSSPSSAGNLNSVNIEPVVVQTASGLQISLKTSPISLQNVDINGEAFQALPLEGASLVGSIGSPALPGSTRWVEIPDGMTPELSLQIGNSETFSGVRLAPAPLSASDNLEVQQPAFDPDAYRYDRLTPEAPAFLSPTFEVGGRRYATLTISPYQYNPARRTLILNREIEATVRFVPGAPASNRQLAPVWRELESALGSQPERDNPSPRTDDLGHIVVIIPNDNGFEEAMLPYVEWKTRKGYRVTLQRTGGDVQATAAGIRAYLLNAWEEWEHPPTFVLLVGDSHGNFPTPTNMDGQNRQVSWYASDNPFVSFVGVNDPDRWIPEALVGRLPAGTAAEAVLMVEKILDYEQNPYTDQPWVEGAVLIAAGVHSCIETNQGLREQMEVLGYRGNRFYQAYSEYHMGQQPDHNVINAGVDNGVGFVNFRGYNNWGNYTTNQIRSRRNGQKLPIVTGMVCGTNDFPNTAAESIGEAWLRASNNGPQGAVACLGPTDLYTHTWFNNTQTAQFYNLLLNEDVHTLGALVLGAKLALIRNYPGSMQLGNGTTVGYYLYTYTLFGDPSMQVWSHDPRPMNVSFDDQVFAGTTNPEFTVTDADDNPIENAYVHLYLNEETRYGGFSDEDGLVSLLVPPLARGEYLLTVTAPNFVPIMDELRVQTVSMFAALNDVTISDDNEGESRGNGDGVVNPGETIEIIPTLINTGSETIQNVSASISCESPFIEINRDAVNFDNIDAGSEAEGGTSFLIDVLPQAPDGVEIEFSFVTAAGQDRFPTYFKLGVTGYRFAVAGLQFEGDEVLTPGSTRRLLIRVNNTGTLDTSPLTGTLYCTDPGIQIGQAEAPFGAVEAGNPTDNSRRLFELTAGADAYLGSTVKFGLLLRDEQGLSDSLIFPITLGNPAVTSPQGPDSYGYWAFDSRDTTTGMAPVFERLQGTSNLNLVDNDDRTVPQGTSGSVRTVDLPFEFTYYGQNFRRITISTNGWMAFGTTVIVGANNQELGSAYVPAEMLAPWWDDLWGGSVLVAYDQDRSRFIIEWRNFRDVGGNTLNFAVALYDPTVTPTSTGDGEIEFHYTQIPQMRDYAEEQVTIGISGNRRHSNLTIRHANYSNIRTGLLRSSLAVRFTTGETSEVGSVMGHIIDEESGAPMQGVRVMLEGTGFYALTDEGGDYQIDGVVVGTYTVIARKLFYNEARSGEINIIQDQTAQADFNLTHPVFNIDIEEINAVVPPDSTLGTVFTVSNSGNGPLDFRTRLNTDPLVGGRDPWSVLFNYAVSDSVGDQMVRGMASDGEFFYIAGPRVGGEYPHMIYVLDREGSKVREFEQYNADSTNNRGYYNLEFNGENLLAVEQNTIVELTREGEFIRSFPTPDNPSYSVAWAPDRGTVFTKSVTGNRFQEIDTDGNIVNLFPVPQGESFRCYGLAWHVFDPEGFKLYILRDNPDQFNQIGTRLQLLKMNPATTEYQTVRAITLDSTDTPLDLDLSKKIDPTVWSLVVLVNRPGGDRLVAYNLGPNLTWLEYSPTEGSLAAGEMQEFSVQFAPGDLPFGEYNVILELSHNSEGDQFDIPVNFRVGWPDDAIEKSALLPTTLKIASCFPNPFNAQLSISFDLPDKAPARLMLFDASGRQVSDFDLGQLEAGRHSAHVTGDDLASGVYLLKLASRDAAVSKKVVLLK